MKDFVLQYCLQWPLRTVKSLSHLAIHPGLFSKNRIEIKNCIKEYYQRKSLVLGTGRSLKIGLEDLHAYLCSDNAKKPVLWAVNNFALSEEYQRFQPHNYVLLDPDFRSFKSVDGADRRKSLLKTLKATSWPIRLWLPFEAILNEMWVEFSRSKPSNVIIVPYPVRTYEPSLPLSSIMYASAGLAPNYQNVVTLCAFLALQCGANEVGLLGADHNWHKDMIVDDQNILRTVVPHFDDQNPPDLKCAPIFMHTADKAFSVSEIFEALSVTFRGHQHVQIFACRENRKIWNLTDGSFIDAYPRANLLNWLQGDRC